MKKILFILLLLLGACTSVEKKVEKLPLVEKNSVYFKENLAYNIVDDMLLDGILIEEDYGNTKYSTFLAGKKLREKLVDENKELVYDLEVNELGAISGLVINYDNYYGEKYIDNYTFGVKNGESAVYIDDEEQVKANFVNGIADGQVKYYNYETAMMDEKTFENGFEKDREGKLDISFFTNFDGTVIDFKELDIEEQVASLNGRLFTGLAVSLNRDGYMEESSYFEDGKLLEYTYYDQNGMVAEKEQYYEDGSSLFIAYNTYNYFGGVNYYNYIKDGVYHGKYAMYYEDGYTFVGNYKDGKLFGDGIYYNSENNVEEIQNYTGDGYTTVSYYDYEKKQVRLKGQGLDEGGVWKLYGRWEYYYEDGSLEEVIDFDGDYGKMIVYDQNGNLIREGTVDAYYNLYEGEVKDYYENGKIKIVSNYSEGYLHGETTYYNEDGSVSKVEVYDYEVLIEER